MQARSCDATAAARRRSQAEERPLHRLAGGRLPPQPDRRRRLLLSGATPRIRSGKLRLLYEANPLAFIAEQAGGAATDGTTRILDIDADRAAPAHAARDRLPRATWTSWPIRCGASARRAALDAISGHAVGPVSVTAGLRPRRTGPAIPTRDLGDPGAFPFTRGVSRRCTAAGSGPCASTPASAPPRDQRALPPSARRRPDRAVASRSICRPRWATTPTRRARSAKSAGSASRSTRSTTCTRCFAAFRSTRSRRR